MQSPVPMYRSFIASVLLLPLLVVPLARAATQPAAITIPPTAPSTVEPSLQDIQTFTRTFELIKKAYVDKVSDHQLMEYALRGMLAGLDPHSEFLNQQAISQLDEETSGKYVGIGIVITTRLGKLQVIAPLDGTPAAHAGIRAGDTIVGINGKAVDPEALTAASNSLRGPPKSELQLTVLHSGDSQPVTIHLLRTHIEVPSVRSRLLAPGIAYLRISQFQQDTAEDLSRQIGYLQKKYGPLRGTVLDLRSNPGGLLTAAVGVANDFLNHGTIVTTRGRVRQANLRFNASPGDLLHGTPLVVLVDGGTASAAEIVAGALKDSQRAVLMGRRSFGKGSVQTVIPLGNGAAVKLTTARYYTPAGTSIQARGIKPNVELADNLRVHVDTPTQRVSREADLPGHLAAHGTAVSPQMADDAALAAKDWWLDQALHAVQAMAAARSSMIHPKIPAAAK